MGNPARGKSVISIFKAAVLSTILSVGAEAGTSDSENNLAQAIRAGASTSINQAGEQIVERNLNIQPTLHARGSFSLWWWQRSGWSERFRR